MKIHQLEQCMLAKWISLDQKFETWSQWCVMVSSSGSIKDYITPCFQTFGYEIHRF